MEISNYKNILKNRDFMILTLTNTFSRLGTRISYIALMARAFELTKDPLSLGIVSILDLIPSVICGLILAYFIDRISKKKIIVVCNFICAAASIVLIITNNIYVLYGVVFLVGGMDELIYSAKSALEPKIVIKKEELLYSNSLKSFLSQTTSIIGPALGGVLVALGGFKLAFLADAVSYLIPVIGMMGIKYKEKLSYINKRALFSGTSILRGNLAGLKYVRSNPVIRQVFLVNAVIQFICGLQGPLLFPFVVEVFKMDSGYAGFLFSAAGVGGLIGSVLAVKIYKGNLLSMFAKILFLDGFMFLLFAQSRVFWLSLILFTFAGAIDTIFETIANGAIQETADSDYIGRVFAAKSLVTDPVSMAASGLGGFLAHNFTVYSIFSLSALGEIIVAAKLHFGAKKSPEQ